MAYQPTATPKDGSVTAAKIAGSLKPSGTAATTDEALRALGTGANNAAAGDAVVYLTGNQTVAGTKTFSSAPVVPDGSFTIAKTTGLQAAIDGKVSLTGAETIAGVKTFSSAPVLPANTVTIANINATGTPSAANFLRGDGTWAAAGGSSDYTVQSLTSAGTATVQTLVKANATTAAFTVTLPAASGNSGKFVHVKKTDSSANAVTVDGNAAETIDGAASYVISQQYESVMLICDGTGWNIV